MIHEILRVGTVQCNCSVFGDEESREALVVDPGDDVAAILETVARHGLKVILGLWVSRFPDLTKFQLDTAIGLANRFPDNTILSHDLIEGCHVRCGFVGDVELVEEHLDVDDDTVRDHRHDPHSPVAARMIERVDEPFEA